MRRNGRWWWLGRSSSKASVVRPAGRRPALELLEDRTVLSLFSTPQSVFLGNNTAPQSVTSGDFRGNGRLDLAIADHGTNAVSVLLSNGDGTFQAPTSYSLGANLNPTFLTSANLNADTKPDLIVVDNANSGFVSVLINNGDGTFATPVKYAVGANPVGVAVADMNGDNKLDLIVANKGDSSLTVLINQGNGAFTAQAPFALAAAPVSITTGDFNNDTKNDVALVAGSNVYVYSGTGSGGFNATPAQYSAGTFPGVIAAGHFRNSGEVDLAVVDVFPSSTGVAILLNNGDGTFANAVLYDLGASPNVSFAGGTPNSLAIGDLTGDGKMDLAIANGQFANNGVSVLLGNGDGTFGSLTSWVAGQKPAAVVIGNFVGDAKADLAVVNQGSNDVSLLRGNGDGTFAAPPTLSHISSPGPVVTGDFNGDGKQDTIVGNTFSLSGVILTEFAGNGDGTFKAPTTINANITNPATGQAKALAAAFMNGDSLLDLVMLDSKGKLDVFLNNGNGTFAVPVVYSAGTSPTDMTIGDFNGDGKPDVAIVNSASAPADGSATIYLNDGTGALTLVGQSPDVGLKPTGVAAADLDGDGKDDLVVTNNNGFSSTVSILISNGDGTFKPKVAYAVDGDPTAVVAAPLRGGKPDLAISTFFGPGLDVLLNNGDGTFAASKSFATGSNPVAVAIHDVTRDGIPDVETTDNFGDSVTVWAGHGDGTFAPSAQTFTVGDRPAMTAAADFNGDTWSDLVTTDGNANDITFLLTGPAVATNSAAANAFATYSTANQTVSLSATVTTPGATISEGTLTFTVLQGTTTIGSPVTVPVSGGATTGNYTLPAGTLPGSYTIQAAYNGTGNFASSVDTTHSLTVAPIGEVQFSVAIARVARTTANSVITVIRTGALSGAVSVQFATSDGTALAGTDYTAENATLTFGPNVIAQTISIPLLHNPQSGGKSLNVTLSTPGGGVAVATPSSLLLTINDPLPVQNIPSNLTAIASAFTHDAEPLSIFVTKAYHLYLKRLPDAQGLAYWVDQLQHRGVTDEMLETNFISSPEYIQKHGGTGQAWVIGMYQDLLGRNPDSAGLSFWTNVLARGGSAFSVAYGFAASAEREGQRIAGDYQIYLGRPLDSAGQAFWVNQFLHGARNEDVVAGFVGSVEYYQNANKGQKNRTAWIDSAFQDIYARDPSAAELAKWLGQMT
jgi:hypothetical protein